MKFSIVVATYNRAIPLKRCVESVLAQNYKNFELLVVDDGSTDSTSMIMSGFTDKRIKYIQLEKNYGSATPARNRGISEMTGDALVIWDSDDVLLPNALEKLKFGFDKFDVGMVCVSTIFYQGSQVIEHPRMPTGILTKYDWINGKLPYDARIVATKKDFIGDVRFRSRGIDFMFYVEILAKHEKAAYVNEICGKVFLESDNLSLTKQRKKMNSVLSRERGEILDSFLHRHKHMYLKAGAQEKYGAYAYGAAVGLLLEGKQNKAIRWAWEACKYNRNTMFIMFFIYTLLPFTPFVFSKIVSLKERRQ